MIDIEKWAEKIHENCMYGASVLDIQDILQAYAAKVHDKRVEELEAKNRELSASINDLREKLETALTSLEESRDRECRCDYTK